ncbi:COPI associated protein-domain-containing protein [Radiomyces spectabilis]|uniref:COPI associated protein-domain-containing protein n=1 Tax=Radiomyces spectabilis TaxID=64574 RepID=UPI00221EA8CF|nr:COPI associated protein-domain-containing protein [Radiomyces spectabilis]KAI8367563.1 COPI associated protein-domain-containing protein [Radiomyces spectabilis]
MLSRTKVENILSLMLNGINIGLYLLVIAAAILKAIDGNFSQIVMCIYGIVIAILLIINEVKSSEIALQYFRFLSIYKGRGMILIFFGCLVLDFGVANIIAGTLNLGFGFAYMILSYVSSFPPPNPIMINWQNWKDFSAEGLDLARPKHYTVEQCGGKVEIATSTYIFRFP